MKHYFSVILLAALAVSGCRITRPMLKLLLVPSNKLSTEQTFADSCEHRTGVQYAADDPAQVLDIYYADSSVRKDAVLIDIHGGFYFAGRRENNRKFASVFLREGYDVVLVEYRLTDGSRDVSTSLADCATSLDYLASNAAELGLNPGRMFLTGDSAGGHLALYMAEGAGSRTAVPDSAGVPHVHPDLFGCKGVLLNCPAYDFASFADAEGFTPAAQRLYLGPRYKDAAWMRSLSPRTFLACLDCPLFLSTCTKDFIRGESLKLRADCESLGRPVDFVDIASDDKSVGHVHNVTDPSLPESREVNVRMAAFLDALLSCSE